MNIPAKSLVSIFLLPVMALLLTVLTVPTEAQAGERRHQEDRHSYRGDHQPRHERRQKRHGQGHERRRHGEQHHGYGKHRWGRHDGYRGHHRRHFYRSGHHDRHQQRHHWPHYQSRLHFLIDLHNGGQRLVLRN